MLQVKLVGDKAVLQFAQRYPQVFKQSIKETTGFAVNRITRSTAKDTGAAHSGWRSRMLNVFSWMIFNVFDHTLFLEEGTGLFGRFKKRIKPKSARVLAFPAVKKNTKTGMIFAASTKGMPAQPAIKPNIPLIEKDLVKRFKLKIQRLWRKTR